jgi:hypothetical protein
MSVASRPLRLLRWFTGAVVFAAAAVVFGQMVSESRSAPVPAPVSAAEAAKYRAVAVADPEVQAALQFALADQQRKNRSPVKLLSVLAAERQSSGGANVRLCLAVDRHGRTDSARVVVHRTVKDQWSVTLWAWGACRR